MNEDEEIVIYNIQQDAWNNTPSIKMEQWVITTPKKSHN